MPDFAETIHTWMLEGEIATSDICECTERLGLDDNQFAIVCEILFGELGITQLEDEEEEKDSLLLERAMNIIPDKETVENDELLEDEASDSSLDEDQATFGQSNYRRMETNRAANPLIQQINNMQQYRRMSIDEAKATFRVHLRGVESAKKLETCGDTISPEEKAELKAQVKAGERAKDEVIMRHWRLATRFAFRIGSHNLDTIQDLIQAGIEGIIKATEHYNPDVSAFSTYASCYIQKYIREELSRQGGPTRKTRDDFEYLRKIEKGQRQFAVNHQRDPTPEELSEITGIPVKKVRHVLQREINERTADLDSPAMQSSGTQRGDRLNANAVLLRETIRDPESERALSRILVSRENPVAELRSLFRKYLTPIEEKIIRLRYGLEDGKRRTAIEIAMELGYTEVSVRKFEESARQKLNQIPKTIQIHDALIEKSIDES